MRYFSLGCSHFLVLLSILYSTPGTPLAQGLSAPTVQATAFEPHYVALQWTDWEGYRTNRIQRKSGGSDWIQVAEAGQANSYMDRTTVPGVTYTYRIQALTFQALFTYSNEASATTDGPTLQPPGAPTLYAETVSHTAIRLRLTGIETGETHYKLERNDSSGEWIEITSLGGLTTGYLDTGLNPADYYPYRIRGWNHAGFSPYAYATATTFRDPTVIPSAPFLHAAERTDTSIFLDWDYQPIASGYRIEWKGPSGTWVEITNIPTATVTYVAHEGLLPATGYAYRMRAYNSTGISDYSAEASAKTYTTPPSSPELRAIALNHSQIELRWTDVLTTCCTADGFIGYRLETLVGEDWRFLHFTGVDDTNYIVRGLQPATEYSFRVAALHPLSSASSTATAKTMDPPPIPPSAPVFYADQYSSIAIDLKWIDVELETEYRIERENSPGGGVWKQIAVVPANTTSYRDIDLEPGTLYVYRIRAANSYGTSPCSHEAAARTPIPISGDIVIGAIIPVNNGGNFRLRLTGSTGQKFKIQSTTDFQSWTDHTELLTLAADMEVGVASVGPAAFYRTIKAN